MEDQSGVALIVTLSIVLVVGLLVLAAAVTGVVDRTMSASQLRSNAAYYLASNGLEVYKTAVFRNLVDYYDETGSGWCVSPLSDGIRDENGLVVLEPGGAWTDWIGSGGGQYRVRLDLDGSYLVLTAEGRYSDAQSTVQLVAAAGGGPASAWDNAILAQGAEAGSKAINGRVAVYGSVHIVDGDLDGTLALGGSSGVYNNYEGPGGGVTNIVAEVTPIVESTNVDLCARLKIAEGNVYLEDNAVELGTSTNPIYSVHLGDGIVCRQKYDADGLCGKNNKTNEVTDHLDSSLVFLREPPPPDGGMNSPYSPFDLGLPVLRQSAFDRAFKTASGGTPVPGCGWLYDAGTVRLPPASSASTSATCGDGSNSVRWIAGTPGYLEISGEVNIPDANVEVNSPLLYQGKGSLLVGEDFDDTAASFTVGGGGSIRPWLNNTYPLVDALAVLSTGDVVFSTNASGDPNAVMMYAQGTAQLEKQVIIIGALVASDFNIGNQVPSIAYHPDIRFAAEDLCLPGTACAEGGAPQNPGILADIAIERR